MGLIYHGAQGCSFKPTGLRMALVRHLKRKSWCPCKDVGWTVEDGVRGQTDGRRTKVEHVQSVNSNNTNNTINNNTTNNNVTINVNLPSNIFPSGSDAERAYLLQHADDIINAIVAGVDGPQAEILSNFVSETWCSDTHTVLNNVIALKSNNHEFVRLHMRGDQPKIQTLAGKDAPSQLVDIARQLLLQLAIDVRRGHNPTRYSVPVYKQTFDTREEAETERDRLGSGTVCQMEVYGVPPRHAREKGWFWIVNSSHDLNIPPRETTELMRRAEQAAWVNDTLKQSTKKRAGIAKVVSSQLRQLDKKHDRRSKLLASQRLAST